MNVSELKPGTAINYKNGSWIVVSAQFVNPGKGGAFSRVKLKNLKTDQVIENTFKSTENIDPIDVVRTKCQYLYSTGNDYHFMDNDNYEQFSLDKTIIGNDTKYLIDGTECYALYIEGIPVSVALPPKMNFKVIESPPGVKGDTATGGSKEVIIETGTSIKVPLFIKQDEIICVNTEDGTYVGKA